MWQDMIEEDQEMEVKPIKLKKKKNKKKKNKKQKVHFSFSSLWLLSVSILMTDIIFLIWSGELATRFCFLDNQKLHLFYFSKGFW